jgi:hypothetical protein
LGIQKNQVLALQMPQIEIVLNIKPLLKVLHSSKLQLKLQLNQALHHLN